MSGAQITERVIVTGELVSATAVHVGASGSDGIVADLEIARDGWGRPIIPGSSLAGLLRARAHVIAAGDPELLDAWRALFGASGEDPHDTAHDPTAPASLLSVDDAVLLDERPRIERRDHVGVDRATGAAAERIKYDRVVVSPGARFALRLVLLTRAAAGRSEAEAHHRLLFALGDQLAAGVTVGAAATRGLGQLQLDGALRATREPLADRADAIAALRRRLSGRPEDGLRPLARPVAVPSVPDDRCAITITWRPDRSLLTRAGIEGELINTLPLTTTVADGRVTLLLPGSSIKGALRFAAERLVRTVTGVDVQPSDGGSAHIGQLQVAVVLDLFGRPATHSARRADGDGSGELDDVDGAGRGALVIPDVYARHDADEQAWQAVLTTEDPSVAHRIVGSTPDGVLAKTGVMSHTALDRWTQGASDGQRFDVLESLEVQWRPIILLIDLARLRDPDPTVSRGRALAAGALLWLVLQELRAGDLPLGGLITRGHGAIDVTGLAVRAGSAVGLTDDGRLTDSAASAAAWRQAIGLAP